MDIRRGTQKFPELLKNLFKVFAQVWNLYKYFKYFFLTIPGIFVSPHVHLTYVFPYTLNGVTLNDKNLQKVWKHT